MSETYTITRRRIPEYVVPGKPLGRHVNHDSRSLAYAYRARPTSTLISVTHKRNIPILDQGDLGSCTGNALVGALGTDPFQVGNVLDEKLAVSIYSDATKIDSEPGSYPPDDTGSDGLSVAKVAKSRGLISGYQHATSLDAALSALQAYPVITGVNWYEGFDNPDPSGRVRIAGQVRGGHEFEVIGCNVAAKTVTAANSWGPDWGANGYFTFSFDDWSRLLDEQGDVTVLLPLSVPAPTPTPPVPPTPAPDADDVFAQQAQAWLDRRPWFYRPFQAKVRTWLAAR